MNRRYILGILALFLAFYLPAQDVDIAILDGLEYRSVGPSRGGRSTAITGIPSEPFTFFMGGTGGGVWITNDAGNTWSNISDGQINAGSIGAIEVAPSDNNVVYVGTGSACPRGNISAGVGMYRSTDKGKSWSFAGLSEAGQIGKIQVHPSNPDLVYVAALGNVFKTNSQRGVFRSSNGGKDWERVHYISDSTGAVDLIMDPNNPRILYAAMWRAQRKPWTLIDGGMEGGIWKSKDGGDSWNKLEKGLPTGVIGRIGLTMSSSNSDRVWAQIQTSIEKDGGLYRSEDGGESWKKINRHHKLRQRGWYYSHITADPSNADVIYASNTGFYKSIDGGVTFSRISTPHGDNHGVWINPNNSSIMVNCNDGGANVSLNGGDTWSVQTNQPTSEFYRVSVDNQFPYRLYAGQQDNTTISVPSSWRPAITPYQHWNSVGGSESGDVAVDPRNPNVVYAGSYSGEITYMDLSKDYVRQVTAYPHYTEGTEQRDLKYRWQWNFPIAINSFNPDEVFHTSNVVHKSTDMGQNWEVISDDLTRAIDEYHGIPGGPVQHDGTGVEIYSTIFAFEISNLEEGVMWAGSDDGMAHITRDAGNTWTDITPDQLPLEATINKIFLSSHNKGKAYLAAYDYRNGDFSPYIFKTNDYGANWTMISKSNGIPSKHFVRAIAEDDKVEGLLFAGTEYGMYISTNDGKSWVKGQFNLPVVPITDIEIKDGSLAMSTQGRSFWVMDDLNPLRALTKLTKDQNYLFEPNAAYRTNVRGKGLSLKFWIPEVAGNEVTVSIEKENRVVKYFSTDPAPNEQKLNISEGLNTMYWNLRIPGPEIVPDFVSMVMSSREQGPYVPPGSYSVKLKVGDWESTQEFQVLKDPRWDHLEQSDFDKQYELGVEMMEMIQESQDMIRDIRSIRTQVTDMGKRAKEADYSEELVKLSEELDKAITLVEDEIIQNKIQTSQDAINYPRKFLNHIGRLYGVLIRYTGQPTKGILDRYEDIKLEHAANKEAFNKVIDLELKNFKDQVEKENVEPIILKKKN